MRPGHIRRKRGEERTSRDLSKGEKGEACITKEEMRYV
jgi:hypothetical protein